MRKEYGPYTRKDGRQIVVIYENGKTTSVSYPRRLVYVSRDEEVHHKDEDVTNNDPSNLEALPIRQHHQTHAKGPQQVEVVCEVCQCVFLKLKKDFTFSLKHGTSITCGRSCASRLGGIASGKTRRSG